MPCDVDIAALAAWVSLPNDDRATVKAAIEAAVAQRQDFDEPAGVDQAKQRAQSEAKAFSRRVQKEIKASRSNLSLPKSRRDNQQAEVERLTRRKDEAANKYSSAVDKISRLAAQKTELEQEIDKPKQHLKKQLANEPVAELITAVLFSKKRLRGPRLEDLEQEAERRASEVAIAEQLTSIESTALILSDVLQHDHITSRISGRAEADKKFQAKVGRGRYLRVRTFLLKPLEQPLETQPVMDVGGSDMQERVISQSGRSALAFAITNKER